MSLNETHAGPQLSAEGEALLRDVLGRRAERTRWERIADAPTLPDVPPPDRPASRWPLVLGLLTIAGLALIAVAVAVSTRGSATTPDPQPTTTAELTGLDPLDIETATIAPSEPAAVDVDEIGAFPAEQQPPDPTQRVDAAPAPRGHIELQTYTSENRVASAVVVRIRQQDGAPIATGTLRFRARTGEGAAVDATAVFEQADLPASGSAIATVRLGEAIADDTVLELILDTVIVASVDLSPNV